METKKNDLADRLFEFELKSILGSIVQKCR